MNYKNKKTKQVISFKKYSLLDKDEKKYYKETTEDIFIEPVIEDKPIYCNAWISKISDKVLCNSIPCCGFCHGVNMEKAIKREQSFNFNNTGKYPLINSKFVFNDGTIHESKK